MLVTYEWVIDGLDVSPEVNGFSNIVTKVYWTLIGRAQDGDITKHTSMFGATELAYDQHVEFTDYQNLTKEQVTSWVKTAVGGARVAAYEDHIADVLKAMAPSVINQPALPW